MDERLRYVAHQERDSVRSLEFFVEMLDRVEEDSYYWKWAMTALHNACHGFMVLALEGTWPVNLLPPKARHKVLQDQYSVPFDDRVYTERISGFMELFDGVRQNSMMLRYTTSRAYSPPEEVIEAMRRLNELRNMDLHFRAMTRIEYVPAFVPMSLHVLGVIDFLKTESGNIGWAHSQVTGEGFEARAEAALNGARIRLAELTTFYERLMRSQTSTTEVEVPSNATGSDGT